MIGVMKKEFCGIDKGKSITINESGTDQFYEGIHPDTLQTLYVPKSMVQVLEAKDAFTHEIKPPHTPEDVHGTTYTSVVEEKEEKMKPKIPLEMSSEEKTILESLVTGSKVAFTDVSEEKEEEIFEEQPTLDAAPLLRGSSLLLPPKECLEPNQFRLSDLTKGKLPDSGKDHTVSAYPTGTWDESQSKDIPEVLLSYYWDANVLEAIILADKLDEKILLTGLPGTGKTTAIKQYAAHIQQPYMRFNGKDGIDQSSFLGYPWATSKGMEWKDGLLPQGMKNGYLVCIDEVFKIPAGIQMAMQNLYEKEGTLLLDDKPGEYHEKLVVPVNSFKLMLTDNVKGTGDDFEKFASTQMQDTSTLDRFGITIEQHYLSQRHEVDMLYTMFPDQKKQDIADLVKLANLVRSGYKQGEISLTLSPRGLTAALSMMDKANVPMGTAIDLAFTNKIAEESEAQSIKQMRDTIGI